MEEDLKRVATKVNLRIASNPEAWFWCLHCERVSQAKELKEDFLGAMSMCPHGNCGACGIGVDIYEIRPDGAIWGDSGPVHGPSKGPALETLSSGQVVSLD